MKRRDFLKKFPLLVGTVALGPTLVKGALSQSPKQLDKPLLAKNEGVSPSASPSKSIEEDEEW